MTKTLYVPDHVKAKLDNPSKGIDEKKTELDKLPKPVGWRILVLPFKAKDKSKGGIILTDYNKERPQQGIVVAIGKGKRSPITGERIPTVVKVGEKVKFAAFSGKDVKVEGKEYFLMPETDIQGIIEE